MSYLVDVSKVKPMEPLPVCVCVYKGSGILSVWVQSAQIAEERTSPVQSPLKLELDLWVTMGVKGLSSLLEDNRMISPDIHFRKSKLVVDGNNLLYHLYFSSNLDQGCDLMPSDNSRPQAQDGGVPQGHDLYPGHRPSVSWGEDWSKRGLEACSNMADSGSIHLISGVADTRRRVCVNVKVYKRLPWKYIELWEV